MEAAASCCTAWGPATDPSSDACLRLHRQLTACPHKLHFWPLAVGLLLGLRRVLPFHSGQLPLSHMTQCG